QGAPFPDASEEVLGATAGGKVYVFAGLAPGWKPKAMVYEYDPASNQWTKKRPMRLASHHVAFATLNNKIYAFGALPIRTRAPPAGTRSTTPGNTIPPPMNGKSSRPCRRGVAQPPPASPTARSTSPAAPTRSPA